MFSTPMSRATVVDSSGSQLRFSMAHLCLVEPIFLCSYSFENHEESDEVGTFLCSKDELKKFLLAIDVPKLIALHVLVPSGTTSWQLREAVTIAHRFGGAGDTTDLAFSDDLELFDSWSRNLPSSTVLVPLWSSRRPDSRQAPSEAAG